MIRLLSVQPVAERGGSDQALLRMVRSLPSDEFDCHIALPGRVAAARDEFAAAGATLHTVPMRRLSTSHGAARLGRRTAPAGRSRSARLVRLIRRLDVDVVHIELAALAVRVGRGRAHPPPARLARPRDRRAVAAPRSGSSASSPGASPSR